MAKWNKSKVLPENINSGNEFEPKDNLTIEELNAIVNNSFYSVDFVEGFTETPDVSDANNVGTPSVELIPYTKDDKTFYKFKFSNLKGQQGIQGIQGKQGVQGIQGVQGENGLEALTSKTYEVSGLPFVSQQISFPLEYFNREPVENDIVVIPTIWVNGNGEGFNRGFLISASYIDTTTINNETYYRFDFDSVVEITGTNGANGAQIKDIVSGEPIVTEDTTTTPITMTLYTPNQDYVFAFNVVAQNGKSPDLSNYATKNEIPTKTSQLDNDRGFITSSDTVANANKVGGIAPLLSGQDVRNKLIVCREDGVIESGKYLDFHTAYTDEEDYAVRVQCPDGVSGKTVNLPSKDGTLALEKFSQTLIPTEEIPEYADLNSINYIKVGTYYCPNNDIVQTLSNCPTTNAFMMKVYSPLSTTVDNENINTYVYRLRKITTFTGEEYIQFVGSDNVVGEFNYRTWTRTMRGYDYRSAWTSVNKASEYTFTHYLGTKDIMIMVELTDDPSGTSIYQLFGQADGTSNSYGNFAYDSYRDENTVKISTANQYVVRREVGGSTKSSWESAYLRVTAWKLV